MIKQKKRQQVEERKAHQIDSETKEKEITDMRTLVEKERQMRIQEN